MNISGGASFIMNTMLSLETHLCMHIILKKENHQIILTYPVYQQVVFLEIITIKSLLYKIVNGFHRDLFLVLCIISKLIFHFLSSLKSWLSVFPGSSEVVMSFMIKLFLIFCLFFSFCFLDNFIEVPHFGIFNISIY